jgi:hypothetical protein
MGILGAFLGAAVGGGLVYGFILWTGFRMPLTGTCVGLLSGIGARVLARGGDATMGAIAATFSVLTVVCIFYYSFHGYIGVGMMVSIIVSGSMAYKLSSY